MPRPLSFAEFVRIFSMIGINAGSFLFTPFLASWDNAIAEKSGLFLALHFLKISGADISLNFDKKRMENKGPVYDSLRAKLKANKD